MKGQSGFVTSYMSPDGQGDGSKHHTSSSNSSTPVQSKVYS